MMNEEATSLTNEQHDQVVLYKLANDGSLKRRFCQHVSLDVLLSLKGFMLKTILKEIKENEREYGQYSATRKFLHLAIIKKINPGWSCHLLQVLQKFELKDLKELLRPNEEDLVDFGKRNGIPRGSLLSRIAEALRKYGAILLCPMGFRDSKEASDRVPVVHPQLCTDDIFPYLDDDGGNYKPFNAAQKVYEFCERIPFSAITRTHGNGDGGAPAHHRGRTNGGYSRALAARHNLYLMLAGPAGSGKTTLTKRIITTCINDGKMVFFISFHQLQPSVPYSLRDLLFRFPLLPHCGETPSDDEVEENFQWVVDNQDKCFIVIDGYDQSGFEISARPKQARTDTKLKPGDLISSLCARKFLPHVRLILTSRPHALRSLPPAAQPDVLIFVADLTDDDMRALMKYYVTTNDHEKIIETLRMKSPRIANLLTIPLFLRLIALLSSECGADVWSYVNTSSKLYYELMKRQQYSAHFGSECRIEHLDEQLMEIAYEATMAGTIVIGQDDLDRHQLSAADIQDLVFSIVENSDLQRHSAIVGFTSYLFHHQSVQEFFTARQIAEKLEIEEFQEILPKIFPQRMWTRQEQIENGMTTIDKDGKQHSYLGSPYGDDSLQVIRTFTIGCFSHLLDRALATDEREFVSKKELFIQALVAFIKEAFRYIDFNIITASMLGPDDRIKVMLDLMDIRNPQLLADIRSRLSSFNFFLGISFMFKLYRPDARAGYFYLLHNFVTTAENLNICFTKWSPKEIDDMFKWIRSLDTQMDEIEIDIITNHDYYLRAEDAVSIFPQISNKMTFKFSLSGQDHHLRGVSDVNQPLAAQHRSNFSEKLKSAIGNFDTNRLQTEQLDVECRYVDVDMFEYRERKCPKPPYELKTLFKITLKRGNPPEFDQ